MAYGLRELNRIIGKGKRTNDSQLTSERLAIEMMELAFDKEKYEDSLARQAEIDTRAQTRFSWAETEKNILGIARAASPIMATLEDPVDIDEEDMKGIKKSIDAFYAESRYARNDFEQSEYDKINISLNKAYDNAVQWRQNMTSLSNIRTDYSNLVGEYEDGGQTRQGEFSVRSTDAILRNTEVGIETSAQMDNEGVTKQFFAENKKAIEASFVAKELEYYQNKPGMLKGETEMFNLAKRQVAAEDIPSAYDTLKGLTASVIAEDASATDDYTENMILARRLYQKRHNDQVKTATAVTLGVFSQPLKAMANVPDDPKSYLTNNDYYTQFYATFDELVNSIKSHESKDDPMIWEKPGTRSVFENLPMIGGTFGGKPNNLEAMALVMVGMVAKDGGQLVYPTGEVYMDAKGDIVNDWGTIYIDEVKWKDKISKNRRGLGYGDAGKGSNRANIASSMSLMAKNFLRVALERHPRELKLRSADSKKTNTQTIIDELANFDESIDTSKPTVPEAVVSDEFRDKVDDVFDTRVRKTDPTPTYENEVPWFEDPKNIDAEDESNLKKMLSKRAFANIDDSFLKQKQDGNWFDDPEVLKMAENEEYFSPRELQRRKKSKQKYSSKNPKRIKVGPSEEDAVKALKNVAKNIGETRRRQLLLSGLRDILTTAEKKKLRKTGKISKDRLAQENVREVLSSLDMINAASIQRLLGN